MTKELREPHTAAASGVAASEGEGSLAHGTPAALYEGRLRHRRFSPKQHRFEHRLFMAWIDLDSVEQVLGQSRWTSARGPAPIRFRREDYFGDPARPLAEAVRDAVAEECGKRPTGAIRLLTHLRTWGVSFNPVSFYYCYGASDEGTSAPIEAIVAEIRNTPWDERHIYVLTSPEQLSGPIAIYKFRKDFHVSPFMPMDIDYTWKLNHPETHADNGRKLFVHMENRRQGERVFDATLDLTHRTELTSRSVVSVLLRYPMMPVRVLFWIYGHALMLWLKRIPFFSHPKSATASE